MNENEEAENRQRLRSPIVYEIVRREAEVELCPPVERGTRIRGRSVRPDLPGLAGNISGGTGLFRSSGLRQVQEELEEE